MKLFLRSLPRLFKNASNDMKRHFSMTFSSVLSISIALLLSMFMIVVAVNVDYISSNVESQLVLQVSLSPILSEERTEQVGKDLQTIEGVDSVTYSSKEQELEQLIEENGEMFTQYEDSNPLYDIYAVHVAPHEDLDKISSLIRTLPGVADVSYGGSAISKLVSIFDSMRSIGYAAAAALMVLGVFLIRNTISMTISVREDEISIMRTVGAYNFFIVTPFILEGLFIGFYAALGPALLIGIGYTWLYSSLNLSLVSDMLGMYPPYSLLPGVIFYDFAGGLLLGAFGSWLAVRKYIRRVR